MFGLEGNSLKHYRKFPKGMGLALAIFEGRFESGGPCTYAVLWKVPAVGDMRLSIHPRFPESCKTVADVTRASSTKDKTQGFALAVMVEAHFRIHCFF